MRHVVQGIAPVVVSDHAICGASLRAGGYAAARLLLSASYLTPKAGSMLAYGLAHSRAPRQPQDSLPVTPERCVLDFGMRVGLTWRLVRLDDCRALGEYVTPWLHASGGGRFVVSLLIELLPEVPAEYLDGPGLAVLGLQGNPLDDGIHAFEVPSVPVGEP